VIADATLLENETSEQPQDPHPLQPAAEEAMADSVEGEDEDDFLARYLAECAEPAVRSQESGPELEEEKDAVEDDRLGSVDTEAAQCEQNEVSGRCRRAPPSCR
jgi:hypothetical protein